MHASNVLKLPVEEDALSWADGLRYAFRRSVSYDDLESGDILTLASIVDEELSMHELYGGMAMKVSCVRNNRGAEGSMKSAFLRVDGPYFEDREAISLNVDGFVGFAGWADSKNVRPFLKAFGRWLTMLSGKEAADGR